MMAFHECQNNGNTIMYTLLLLTIPQFLIAVYSKAAIAAESAQPMQHHGISNTVVSACAFRVVGAAAGDLSSCSVFGTWKGR
jgi:hypothetical protein